MLYLDNAATTRPFDEILEKAREMAGSSYFNPSSSHGGGFAAKNIIERARESLAADLRAKPEEVVFNSGATEGNNTILLGAASRMRPGDNIVITPVEHPSALSCAAALEKQGIEVRRCPVERGGYVEPGSLAGVIDTKTRLFFFIHVNNVTGIIQDSGELIRKARSLSPRIHIHADAVQGFCKGPCPLPAADTLTISGHKIHALKGVGALVIRKGAVARPLILGGGQERGMRSGTENTPAIFSIAESARMLVERQEGYYALALECEKLLDGFTARSASFSANREPSRAYSPFIYSLCHENIPGAVLQNALSEKGIYVSTGSACGDKRGVSDVLIAMGYGQKRAAGTVRISLSAYNSPSDIAELVSALEEADASLSGLYKKING